MDLRRPAKLAWWERAFPSVALWHKRKRIQLEMAARVYDAAKGSSYHVAPTDARSGDAVMEQAGDKIRKWARHLDENHDLSIGILDVLVNNVVGAGITVEPMVMTKGGKPADKVNKQIRKLWKDWSARPEVTGELPGGEMQRLICRSWFRDGEVLIQHVRGTRFRHYSDVPYSVELIEADFLPFQALTGRDRVVHGVEKNAWGQPLAYWFYKQHPGNLLSFLPANPNDLRRAPADDIIHLKLSRRIRQTRGVPIFHGVIRRLEDVKDYEESERIAARVAASLTAFIQKGEDFTGELNAVAGDRSFEMQPGMIFDNLQQGEEVGMIKSDRPNQNLGEFVKSQLRALAAGTGTNYSSISKDYNGTYSAQRQELVESQPAYKRLQECFIETVMRRIHRELVTAAVAVGVVQLSRNVDPETLFDTDMRAPAIPWIDPMKETQADALAVEKRFISRTQVIRNRGGDPNVVNEQIKKEREQDREDGFAGPDSGDGGNENPGTGSDAEAGGDSDENGNTGDDAAAA